MGEDMMMSAGLKTKLEQLRESINTRTKKVAAMKFKKIKQQCYRCNRETTFEVREDLVGDMGEVAVYCKLCAKAADMKT